MQPDVHKQTWHVALHATGIADPERHTAPGPRRFQTAAHQVVLAEGKVMVVAGIEKYGQTRRRWRQPIEPSVRQTDPQQDLMRLKTNDRAPGRVG